MSMTMSDQGEAIYLGGHSEAYLARFQQHQGQTNNCGEFAVAAAVSLLRGEPLDYAKVVDLANRWTLVHSVATLGLGGRGRRLWPGGPTAPRQQAELAVQIGKRHGLKLSARHLRGTVADLLYYLRQPDTVVLITIGWDKDDNPEMIHPAGLLLRLTVGSLVKGIDNPFEAHVMVLGAYDPRKAIKRNGVSVPTPWGLINWWVDGRDETQEGYGRLFWMTDEHFRSAWLYEIPFVSSNMVVVRREAVAP